MIHLLHINSTIRVLLLKSGKNFKNLKKGVYSMSMHKYRLVTLFTILLLCTSFMGFPQQAGPDGSFSYSYPVALPAGTNGMNPALSFVYHSNSGNNMPGIGWSLDGLPAITRDSSYDITFDDTTDHFLYGGQRLILKNGTTNEYSTEKESFLKIEAVYTGDTISYWKITDKSGKRMYFGYNAPEHHTGATDGHVDAIGKDGKALLWSLSKAEDTSGNSYYVQYHEDTENGDYYPANITYTENSSSPLPVTCATLGENLGKIPRFSTW
jgi:hypothetical protein